jgi:molybdopterin synthase sulfur carrier subunit
LTAAPSRANVPRMVRVSFTANLQRHVGAPDTQVAAGTLRAVLDGVFAVQPALRGYVLDDQEGLRKHVTVFIDGTQIGDRRTLSDPVADGAEVWVMQALSGG